MRIPPHGLPAGGFFCSSLAREANGRAAERKPAVRYLVSGESCREGQAPAEEVCVGVGVGVGVYACGVWEY